MLLPCLPAPHPQRSHNPALTALDLPFGKNSGGQMEETQQDNATKTLDFKQPTLEDLGIFPSSCTPAACCLEVRSARSMPD